MAIEKDDDIARYADGSLSGKERQRLERKALDDPFLRDALEGTEEINGDFAKDVAELNSKLQPAEKSWLVPLRLAAGVVLIAAAATWILWPAPVGNELASTPKKADSITRAKKDSALITLAKPVEKEVKESGPAAGSMAAKKPTVTSPQPSTEPNTGAAVASADQRSDEAKGDVAELADTEPAISSAPKSQAQKYSLANESKKKEALDTVVNSLSGYISGSVIAADDKKPLPGVSVVVAGTTIGTTTDANGNYNIQAPPGARLQFSYVGMLPREVTLAPSQSSANVSLKEDNTQLSDVVVTGVAPSSEEQEERIPVVVKAAPIGGIKAYNQYLEKNLRYPEAARAKLIKGKVTLQFTVTTSGQLTEFNVVKSLGYGCDEEVIRLVKEGPAWTPGTLDDVPVESEVLIRLKFDPRKSGN